MRICFVNSMSVRVVKINNVADGFDEGVSRFVFGHYSVAETGEEIFEYEPAGEASD